MSKINVYNLIKQWNLKSNIYLPVIEAIVNSIDAIDDENRVNSDKGMIKVTFERDASLLNDDEALPEFINVTIYDNGIGFNSVNVEAFDTLFTERKINKGGKGFGRVMYKKHFQDIKIESVFYDVETNSFKHRYFVFGNDNIVDEGRVNDTDDTKTWSKVYLKNRRDGRFDKKLETVSKRILENLLPYFITEAYLPPTIILKDDQSEEIILNDLYRKSEYIKNIKTDSFELKGRDGRVYRFSLFIFKIYSPQNKKSKISLVADKREVTSTNISDYIPEFEEEFFDEEANRNFIIKAYVLGEYLDENVNLERLSFKFGKKEANLFFPFLQKDIEEKVSGIIESLLVDELTPRREKKKSKVYEYIQNNPWFSDYKGSIAWNDIPMNPSDETIESHLHLIKYKNEKKAKSMISNILKNVDDDFEQKINDIFLTLDKAKQSELAHYVSLRKVVLDVFKASLKRSIDGRYSTEQLIHNIIFPTKKDSEDIAYREHNLWLLDERLSFTEYLTSDKPIFNNSGDRPDIFCFDKKVAFRGDNEATNPIAIFEFKRPGRDDFVNQSSKEDPYDQIIRYIGEIKDGKLTTVNGRPISVAQNTPFYGYIIADLTGKVKNWLENVKDFDPTPDGEGYFKYHNKLKLYTEFISWDKLLRDAEMRNKVFFNKLGI